MYKINVLYRDEDQTILGMFWLTFTGYSLYPFTCKATCPIVEKSNNINFRVKRKTKNT